MASGRTLSAFRLHRDHMARAATNYDGSSLPGEPMGARIGLGSAPFGECPFIFIFE